jgi:hypothetical protein
MLTTLINETKQIMSNFLFELCESDVETFSKEFGYGNIAGFLVERGLLGDLVQ